MSLTLTDERLRHLMAEWCQPPVQALALSGSYARDQADRFSDLDLVCYVPPHAPTKEWLGYRDGLLVSVDHQHVEARLRDLTHPESAVRAVMPLRRLRALYDPEGVVATVQRAARAFEWSQVAAQGQTFAAQLVAHQAEVIQKLLGGLERQEAARTWSATTEVVGAMLVAMAVWRGVLVDSGNTYAAQVWAAVGPDTAWSWWHRLAAGVDGQSTLAERGQAALALYSVTVREIESALSEEERELVAEVCRRVEATGVNPSRLTA